MMIDIIFVCLLCTRHYTKHFMYFIFKVDLLHSFTRFYLAPHLILKETKMKICLGSYS